MLQSNSNIGYTLLVCVSKKDPDIIDCNYGKD